MRDYTGISVGSLPPPDAPDFHSRLRDMLAPIDYYLRDLSRGVQRISVGEVPDGSGTPIGGGGTLTDYWFKPGISDPFIAYMGSGSGQGGTLSSNPTGTKGSILLGDSTAFDEVNTRLGIGTTSPGAVVHLSQRSDTTTLRPSATVAGAGCTGQDSGTTNLHNYVNDANDGTYLHQGSGAASFRLATPSGAPSSSATHTVFYRYRNNTAHGTSINLQFELDKVSTVVHLGPAINDIPISASWTQGSFTLSAAEITAIAGDYTDLRIVIASGGFSGTPADNADVSDVWMTISGSPVVGLIRWDVVSGTAHGGVDANGKLGVGTDSQILSAMATLETTSPGTSPLYLIGATSQTADFLQVQSQAGAVLTNINSVGDIAGGVLVSDALSLLSNTFNTSVARITLTNSQDVIFDVPSGSVDPLVISMGTVSATMSGLALTVNLQDTGGNNSTVTVDNRGGSASPIPLKVYRATNGSTANLTEWRDEVAGGSNAILSRISSSGTFVGPISVTNPSSAYTPTNVTTDRAYDANATTLDEVADVLGTVIADLQAKGILG